MEPQTQTNTPISFHLNVATVTFQAPDTGYSVLRCKSNDPADKNGDIITVTGTFPGIRAGANIVTTGQWVKHPRFGLQFKAESWHEEMPVTDTGIRKYLSSNLVYGIGPVLADRLVDTFGKDTFDVIENHPERLSEVPGIGKKKINSILKRWKDQKYVREIMVFLKDHDVTDTLATKIYNHYGESSIERLRENPYCLADDLWGVGFKTADNLALHLNVSMDSPYRIKSGIRFALEQERNNGHMYVSDGDLISTTMKLLSLDDNDMTYNLVWTNFEALIKEKRIVHLTPGGETYLPQLYEAEINVAQRLRKLQSLHSNLLFPTDIAKMEQTAGLTLAPAQHQAVAAVLQNGVTVLTGGPGTGKTTTVRAIIVALKQNNARVLLASPTGKAAKRLEQATGEKAMTIHRLLEFSPGEGGFQRNAMHTLEGDAIIVDEASMIDGQLMHYLLSAVPNRMKVVLVGDADQLPSVGAGNCLREIIASGVIPTIRLTTIFRQSAGSDIITGAHAINSGHMPNLSGGRDLWFQPADEPEPNAEAVIQTYRTLLQRGVKSEDIQVLTPMKVGPVGTIEMNKRIQNLVNPNGKAVQKGIRELRIGDRVVNLKNDYENDVFNGDQGVISDVDEDEETITVHYESKDVVYKLSETDCLLHAWALTIHRSQGSEFPVSIIIMSTQHWIMLQRTLLYTAVTRAKQLCFIIGSYKATAQAVHNNEVKHRNTLLAALLRGER